MLPTHLCITFWSDLYRFAHADFVLAKSLLPYDTHPYILVTDDIGCQYEKKLVERFKVHSPNLTDAAALARIAIGKMHVQAHKDDCQYLYALQYITGAGSLGGETIETGWAETNHIASFTREMGQAFRHDRVNDQFNDCNWQKHVNMGEWFVYFAALPCLLTPIQSIR